MSTLCWLMTAGVPPESVPDALETSDQAVGLINSGYLRGELLKGMSPNEWVTWAVEKLAAAFSIRGLEFFRQAPKEGEDCTAFLFKPAEMDRIDSAISTMLARAECQADLFAKTLDWGYDADDVLQALRRAEASLEPDGDDGEGVNFLFAYLKSFQWFCRANLAKGWALVHVQWI